MSAKGGTKFNPMGGGAGSTFWGSGERVRGGISACPAATAYSAVFAPTVSV